MLLLAKCHDFIGLLYKDMFQCDICFFMATKNKKKDSYAKDVILYPWFYKGDSLSRLISALIRVIHGFFLLATLKGGGFLEALSKFC